LDSNNVLSIEFSVPKYLIGHNIYLIDPKDITGALFKLHKEITKLFGDFPSLIYWEITRIDFCYSWKLRDHEIAVKVMEMLQKLDYPKKKKYIYSDAVMFKGSEFSLKFYLKDNEFYVHDFKELKKLGHTDLAYELYDISRGVLRFEATIRRKQLARLLYGEEKSKVFWQPEHFSQEIIEGILNAYLRKILMGLSGFASNNLILQKLVKTYGKTRGIQLYLYYKEVFSGIDGKSNLRENLSRASVYRIIKQLRKAGVGLNVDASVSDFSLSIPSSDVVNVIARPPDRGAGSV